MEMEAFKVRFCCLQTAEQETRRFCSGRRDLQPPTRPLRIIIFEWQTMISFQIGN
jgi:hypothetical protein